MTLALLVMLLLGGTTTTAWAQSPRDAIKALCEEGDLQACASLGADGDYSACRHAAFGACSRVAERYRVYGPLDPADGDRAAHFYMRDCEQGWPLACLAAGLIYDGPYPVYGPTVDVRYLQVAPDHVRAATMYRLTCDAGEAQGCAGLTKLAAGGHGTPRDPLHASVRYQGECDRGDIVACATAARLRFGGARAQENSPRAAAAAEQSCRAGDAMACYEVARRHRDGVGVAKDLGRALGMFAAQCGAAPSLGLNGCREACELGAARACLVLVDAAEHPSPEHALRPADATALRRRVRAIGRRSGGQ